jgi:hypothetical protein
MLARLWPPASIVVLALVFFADLVIHPTHTLYGDNSDLLAYFIPVKQLLVRGYQENGELPLWNPYPLAGLPLVADIQVCAFYPPHLPLYWVAPEHVAAGLSWLIVFHVIAAGWCMYAYALTQGLGRWPSFVAALGYMFAGKWLMHLLAAGHSNLTPLAWLPLVLLGLEGLIRRGSLAFAVLGAGAFALIVVGTHPQITLYVGLFVGLWTLAPALERAGHLGGEGPRSGRRTLAALGRWALAGGLVVALAVGLSAVQLLPAMAATGLSSRGSSTLPGTKATDLVRAFFFLTGPPPLGFGWESRGGLALTWVAAAAAAARSGRPRVRYWAAVGLMVLLLALGGLALLEHAPLFRLFRLPVRVLFLTALPLALLTGECTRRLFDPTATAVRKAALARPAWCVVILGLVLLGAQPLLPRRPEFVYPNLPGYGYWVALGIAIIGFLALITRPGGGWARKVLWTAVLLLNLWGFSRPLVATRDPAEVYEPTETVRFLAEQPGFPRELDRSVLDRDLPGDLDTVGYVLPMTSGVDAVRGYNPLDIYRYKEYVRFIEGQEASHEPKNLIRNVIVKNRALLDLLGTRYLVQPSDEAVPTPDWVAVHTAEPQRVFSFTAGGMRELPPCTTYENRKAFPRAFIVPHAEPLPDPSGVSAVLSAADTDFHRTVWLEDFAPGSVEESTGGTFRAAKITERAPNLVRIVADGESPGYLVLTDNWYPGWTATVDGREVKVYRSDYTFRTVALPAGRHEVVFKFDPVSYRIGRLVSLASVAIAAGLLLLALLRGRRGEPGHAVASGAA